MKKSKFEGVYESRHGRGFQFTIDLDEIKEYELEDSINAFCSATKEFAKAFKHQHNAGKMKLLGLHKDASEKKIIIEGYLKKAAKDIKEAKIQLEKTMAEIEIFEKKTVLTSRELKETLNQKETQLKKNLIESELSVAETEHFWNEYLKNKEIFETKGRKGVINHLHSQLEAIEVSLHDPKEYWREVSNSPIVFPWWIVAMSWGILGLLVTCAVVATVVIIVVATT